MLNRKSIARVFASISVVMLVAIGFVATPPPNRMPLFFVDAILVLPVVVFGTKWQRVFGCLMLVIVLYLAEGEYSSGKAKQQTPTKQSKMSTP